FKAGDVGEFALTVHEAEAKAPQVADLAFRPVLLAETGGKLTAEDGVDAQGKFSKVYSFKAEPAKMYRFDLVSKQFDAYLRLEDGNGKTLKNEDAGDSRTSKLTFTADRTGDFRVVVSGYRPGEQGEFTLKIIESRVKGTPAA